MAVESYLKYDKDLTRIALGYKTRFDPAVLEIAPLTPAPKSFQYPSYSSDALDTSNIQDLRAIFDPNVSEIKSEQVSWTSITLPEYTLKVLATDRQLKGSGVVEGLIASNPTDGAKMLKDIMYDKLQNRIISATINAIDVNHKTTPANKWDTANGDPMADLRAAIEIFGQKAGTPPSHMLIPDIVLIYLGQKLRSYFGVTTKDTDVMQLLNLGLTELGVPNLKIVLGHGKKWDTSNNVFTSIYSDNVLLWYSPPKVEKWTPCFAKTFTREGAPDIRILPPYDHPDKIGQFVQAIMEYYPTITMQDAGYLLYDVLS